MGMFDWNEKPAEVLQQGRALAAMYCLYCSASAMSTRTIKEESVGRAHDDPAAHRARHQPLRPSRDRCGQAGSRS